MNQAYPYIKHASIPVQKGELWTSRQRQMHGIHYTVSYRASFKPELPDFFIRKFLNKKNALILDPFGGRGTTIIQANLLGHRAIHNDLNPVAGFLAYARRQIPDLHVLKNTLDSLVIEKGPVTLNVEEKKNLLPFFHEETLNEIIRLRKYLLESKFKDPALNYIGLTALSRLHGHSEGFFSVYSFPQISILPEAQRRNNLRRNQTPPYRNIKDRILKKMQKDLTDVIPVHYHSAAKKNKYINCDARKLKNIKDSTVDLVVTSPPFLDKVNYLSDNWMRSWFLGYDLNHNLTMTHDLGEWLMFMRGVFVELGRVLKPGARAVIEVGEVASGGKIRNLEEYLLDLLPVVSKDYKLIAEEVLIHEQQFTKLANCWKVDNNVKGTNTNRCLIMRKVK